MQKKEHQITTEQGQMKLQRSWEGQAVSYYVVPMLCGMECATLRDTNSPLTVARSPEWAFVAFERIQLETK